MLCHLNFEKNDYVITSASGHKFHEKCLHGWILKQDFTDVDDIISPVCGLKFLRDDKPKTVSIEEPPDCSIYVS